MSGLLPSSPDTSPSEDADPLVVGVDSDDADELLGALSSKTARAVVSVLYEEPATPSAIADEVDTSLQNVQYHLSKLEEADLIEIADTMYSEKGREMNVYRPTSQPLVVFAGNEEETTGLKAALSRLLGSLGVLGLASLVIHRTLRNRFGATSGGEPSGAPAANESGETELNSAGAESSPTQTGTPQSDAGVMEVQDQEATQTAAETTTQAATEAAETTMTVADSGGQAVAAALPPGALFFAGGAAVLLVGFGVWYWRNR